MNRGVEWWAAEGRGWLTHPAVVVGAVAVAGSAAPEAPVPALCVAGFWLTIARLNRRWWAVALVAFAVTGVRATGLRDGYRSRWHAHRAQLGGPKRCFLRAHVTSSPTRRSGRPPPAHGDSLSLGRAAGMGEEPVMTWYADASHLDCEGRELAHVMLRLSGGPEQLARGDRVEVIAQLAPLRLYRNADLSDAFRFAARRHATLSGRALSVEVLRPSTTLAGWVDGQRARVRRRIRATFRDEEVPLAKALVLGENDLGQDQAEAFRQSGLLHLLAVSGTHLVIAVVALVQALRHILVRLPSARRYDLPRLSSALGALASLLYADFSGGSGSAWRAAFMLCLVLGARALGRRVGGAAALGGSLVVGAILDPLVATDLSFLLSALATAGLIGLGPPLVNLWHRGWWQRAPQRYLALSLIATVVSSLPCAPVLAMMDGDMTWAALLANVVAGPFGELVALPACLAFVLCAPFPSLEQGLADLGSGALFVVRHIALWSAAVEGARFEVPYPSGEHVARIVCATLGASAVVRVLPRRPVSGWVRSLGLPLALVSSFAASSSQLRPSNRHSLGATPASSNERASLSITALDVGQGDALLVEFPGGQVGLVDGGGFPLGVPDTATRVLLPVLRARAIERIDLMVLSHPHPDHLTGLLGVAERIPVDRLWHPGFPDRKSGPYRQLIESVEAGGGRVQSASQLCGRPALDPSFGARARVLWPCAQPAGPPLGANDLSLVLRLDWGRHRALLTGDIEAAAEAALLHQDDDGIAQLDADLLKVAHHGSDTSSSPAFLDAVRPRVALISSGVRNRFNHPRPSTLRALRARRVLVGRTDLSGSITWSTDGRHQTLQVADSDPRGLANRSALLR